MDNEACELISEGTENKDDVMDAEKNVGQDIIDKNEEMIIDKVCEPNTTVTDTIKDEEEILTLNCEQEQKEEILTLNCEEEQKEEILTLNCEQEQKEEIVTLNCELQQKEVIKIIGEVKQKETIKITEEEQQTDLIIVDNISDSVNNIGEDELQFKIEVEPDEFQNGTPNGSQEQNIAQSILAEESFEVPSYDTEFTGFLTAKEYSIETGKHIPNDAKPKKTCFNCLGDHNINECEEKKNFKDIARNRQNILGRRNTNTRYHEEAQNKYGNFIPGKISDSLRCALGLREQDAPEHVYRMRVLGYPPGWLKEAEVRRSAVSLFDGNGKVLSHPEDEEGETDVNVIKYQPDKLITFPGFNSPFPDGIKDDHRYYRCPEMQPHHRREEFERFMIINRVTKYKRKKLKASDTPQSHIADAKPSLRELADTEAAMEICSEIHMDSEIEFNPPLPAEELPPLPETPQANGNIVEIDVDESLNTTPVKSPVDSNEEADSILTADSSMDSTNGTEEGTDTSLLASTPNDRLSSSITETPTTDEIPNPFQTPLSSHAKRVPVRKHRSMSKSFTLGTCIPESITPFKTLPSPDKWGVDISDHINFDNLPDALGTWSKMKGIVKTVRTYIETMNVEEDED